MTLGVLAPRHAPDHQRDSALAAISARSFASALRVMRMPSGPNTVSMIRLNRVGLMSFGAEGQREVSPAVAIRQGEPGGVVGAALECLHRGAAAPAVRRRLGLGNPHLDRFRAPHHGAGFLPAGAHGVGPVGEDLDRFDAGQGRGRPGNVRDHRPDRVRRSLDVLRESGLVVHDLEPSPDARLRGKSSRREPRRSGVDGGDGVGGGAAAPVRWRSGGTAARRPRTSLN